MKKKIAIFASGGGSNAEVILNYFNDSVNINIALIVTNNQKAFVLQRAKKHKIPSFYHSVVKGSNTKLENQQLEKVLQENKIDFIVLAGYLKKIPSTLIQKFEQKIVNIHPALLPKFGGKGMYGMNVHRAVLEANEKESGITIHYVNENYDEGNTIEQHKCSIDKTMTAEQIQQRVLELEHKYFAPCIKRLLE